MVTVLAVAAAFCYALGAALQHAVAADPASLPQGDGARSGAAGFLVRLARTPGWQAGNVLNALGWGLQAAALARGELSYVQPLLLLSVVLSLPLTASMRGDRAGVREWGGALLLVAGVSAFLAGAEPGPSQRTVEATSWMWAFVAVGLTCAACLALARGSRAATALAVAAGLVFGLAAALTKATVDTGLGFLSHWPVYALVIATALGFYWMQRAYQSGPLAASFPVIIALDPLVSVLLGVLLFGEQVSTAPAHQALALAGASAIVGGIAVLSRSCFIEAAGGAGDARDAQRRA